MKDIIFLTVDTWRDDTRGLVPNLSARLTNQTEMICAGAATNFVFPSILNSIHYPEAYDESGRLRSESLSLPEVLSEAGYETAGFVACNPFLSKWSDRFDEFWNGRIGADSTAWYSSDLEKWLSRAYRTAFLRKRVPATEVAERGSNWYRNTEGPRFLWMHVMEPHLPYYPGIKRAREVGLLKSYHSILNFQRHKHDTPEKHINRRRRLYEKCVELFDHRVPALLDFVTDDAMIVAFGDHGEEFEHGHIDHERLYDECVKVPLFFKNCDSIPKSAPVRQIDIAPRILDELGVETPAEWTGSTGNSLESTPALMLTPQREPYYLHAGIRSDGQKLINTFDRSTGELQRVERYDLTNDPHEQNDLSSTASDDELTEKLDEFVTKHENALEMNDTAGAASEAVQERLESLGYK